ncbi:hypothetical protein [uncultured Chryseobacterium sp.]|uniref:hypothetical protein n=1 Tax=uncultured Chryseobacterium sp. TaxID=259322 RepID=UPI0025E5C20D|nr:hypothetical protein [uncultured Chryseobacterium sp.]
MKNYLGIKNFTVVLLLIFGCISISSCSSDDDQATPADGNKNYKFTISVNSAIDDADYISFVIVGASYDTNQKTFWKVNGVTKNNEAGVSLGDNDFTGGTTTYVIESVTPFKMAISGIQVINFNSDLKFSFKAEVNGEVVVNDTNKTLSGNGADFTKDYDF